MKLHFDVVYLWVKISNSATASAINDIEIEEEEINAALKRVLILLEEVNDLSKSAK